MTLHNLAYSRREGFFIDYGREIEQEIVRLQEAIDQYTAIQNQFPPRWLAIKLLEQDEELQHKLKSFDGGNELLGLADERIEHLSKIFGDDVDTIIADRRYGWINGLTREVIKKTKPDRINISDQIDKIVTNRFLGIPIFLGFMWILFKLATDVANPYLKWIDFVMNGPITNWIASMLTLFELNNTWVHHLLIDGVIAGVGGILAFVPVFMVLYMALAVLEDSGYMARGAFVMDQVMHLVGLHGKSFVPMVVGFGCTVPALYATRTLENQKDRVLTSLLVPFMSCGARLPVYVLFSTIFFPQNAGTIIFGLYITGIIVALLLGMLFKNTLFKEKEVSPFVMELPPYRVPTFRSVWIHTWERTSSFIKKAWTVIMLASIIIWILLAIPVNGNGSFDNVEPSQSVFGSVANFVSPIFKPTGFGDWQASGSLLAGITGKEVIVSTFSQVYNISSQSEDIEVVSSTFLQDLLDIVTSFIKATFDTIRSVPKIIGINLIPDEEEVVETTLMSTIQTNFNSSSGNHGKLAGLSFMVFVLLYTPCVVSLAVERQEIGTKWMLVTIIGQFVLAWIVSAMIFQTGIILGLG